jgi:hypothetical protein
MKRQFDELQGEILRSIFRCNEGARPSRTQWRLLFGRYTRPGAPLRDAALKRAGQA